MALLKSFSSFLLLLSLGNVVSQDLTCTISAGDEQGCLGTKGDSGQHCAWCNFASFGFCVNEAQAENIEHSLPGVSCDRYSGSDDDSQPIDEDDQVPNLDDYASVDDDKKPDDTDDKTPANTDDKTTDDNVPDNFWDCLQAKTEKDCGSKKGTDGCTWCDTKGGFGLCMTGPTAESAAKSDWFTCESKEKRGSSFFGFTEFLRGSAGASNDPDPYDPSCVMAYLQDQTKEGCVSASDEAGQACEYCTLQGMLDVCLTEFQAEQGSVLGITCDAKVKEEANEDEIFTVNDPLDTSCLLAIVMDPTEEGCAATVDEDGKACEWCTMGGSLPLCLSADQADIAGSFGVQCGDDNNDDADDLLDTTCVTSAAADSDSCHRVVTKDNSSCQFCTFFNGMVPTCLSAGQAKLAQSSFGGTCEDNSQQQFVKKEEKDDMVSDDPYDPSCLAAYLQDPTEEGCVSASDEDGANCEYCSIMGQFNLCLTEYQAEQGESFGLQCTSSAEVSAGVDEQEEEEVELPPDFMKCLQNYQEGGCENNGCTWCNTQVGLGFCMAGAAAEALKDCTFFDCIYSAEETETVKNASAGEGGPYDLACLTAGMGGDNAQSDCSYATDENGEACVWCDAAGVFGVCVSANEAATVSGFLDCDAGLYAQAA